MNNYESSSPNIGSDMDINRSNIQGLPNQRRENINPIIIKIIIFAVILPIIITLIILLLQKTKKRAIHIPNVGNGDNGTNGTNNENEGNQENEEQYHFLKEELIVERNYPKNVFFDLVVLKKQIWKLQEKISKNLILLMPYQKSQIYFFYKRRIFRK